LELATDAPQRANNLLKEEMDRWRVSLFGDRLHVVVDEDADTGIRKLTNRLQSQGINVTRAREQTYSLEDVFIAVVEKMRREGKSAEE
jgi:ABC-2 type transport system ATP-binding protein